METEYGQVTSQKFAESFMKLSTSNELGVEDKVALYHIRKRLGQIGDDFRELVRDSEEKDFRFLARTVIPGEPIGHFPLSKALSVISAEDAVILTHILKEE